MGNDFQAARVYFSLSSNADELNAGITAYEADLDPETYADGSVWCEPQWDESENKWFVIVKDPEHLEFVEEEGVFAGMFGYFVRLFR